MKCLILISCLALGACSSGGGGGNTNPPADPPSGGLPPAFSVLVSFAGEVEPNDSIAAANSLTMPSHSATADFVGTGAKGSVNDLTDVADFFSFTAARKDDFTIKLCDSMCSTINSDDTLDVSIAYFEVLDQFGTLILSSQGGGVTSNFQTISIDAGVIYFIAVFPEDTVGANQVYFVSAVEKLPIP
jgi:hypothetical protein